MNAPATDLEFAGSIPALYESHLVPLIFASYAQDVGRRLRGRPLRDVLEVAAGTGVVTRVLAASLPAQARIVASDLNDAMLAHASTIGTARPVVWQRADAMRLPFADASFDAVVCQFGAMFFPDRPAAYAEARRVLRPGGLYLFSVWDRIEDNEFADVVTQALAETFPDDPPRFLARTPHGYHDRAAIAEDVARAGFRAPVRIDTVTARSRADSSLVPAVAYCQGTPLRNEIEARGPDRLAGATHASAVALARRFGDGPVDGKVQAHVVEVAS